MIREFIMRIISTVIITFIMTVIVAYNFFSENVSGINI